jgi:hypothetical protein
MEERNEHTYSYYSGGGYYPKLGKFGTELIKKNKKFGYSFDYKGISHGPYASWEEVVKALRKYHNKL